jgi:hypothetical protein
MPAFTAADTIRILVATDSHVGYEERDPIRKDDSWRSFDEVMRLAKSQDVSATASPEGQLLTWARLIWSSSLETSSTITSLPEKHFFKLCGLFE